VELVAEGVEGVCVKHLVEERRLRIKLDPFIGPNGAGGVPVAAVAKTVWRTLDCVRCV
jgi:hypothetical protein